MRKSIGTRILALTILLTLTGCWRWPASDVREATVQTTWFPIVFNEGTHPFVPPDILGCYGYSQVPGYTGPPEYPTAVEPDGVYITCYPNPGCRLGRVGQFGDLVYKCAAGECTSSGVLAGGITILLTNVRIDNRDQDWWVVLTKEECNGGDCDVAVVRDLYPFEAGKTYAGGTHIMALPPDLAIGEANGFGLRRSAVGLVAWLTFDPCVEYESHNVGQPEMWTFEDLARFK